MFESFVIAGNVDNCFKRLLVDNLVVLPLLRFVVLLLEIRSNICRDRQADGGGGQTAGRGRGSGDRPMD